MSTGDTELYTACELGELMKVKNLLAEGSNPCKKHGWRKWTPLHVACDAGHLECMQHLLTLDGIKLSLVDSNQCTSLHLACIKGYNDIVEYIVNAVDDCDFVNSYGETPLHYACEYGNIECVKTLVLKGKVDVNKVSHRGHTSLYLACLRGRPEIVKFLVNLLNCDPLVRSKKNGNAAIHAACSKGHLDCLGYLVDVRNVDVDVLNDNGTSPLHFACEKGHINTIHHLLRSNCNPCFADYNKDTAVHIVSRNGHTQCLKLLFECGRIDINALNVRKRTPLHLACFNGRYSSIAFLLTKANCNPNIQDENGNSPLHLCIPNIHQADLYSGCFQELISYEKVKPNQRNQLHQTPLHLACINGLHHFVRFLAVRLDSSTSISKDVFGNTPIHYSTQNGHLECLKVLVPNLKDNSVFTIENNDNQTILHLACIKGHLSVFKYLLSIVFDRQLSRFNRSTKLPVDINDIDRRGRTLLHHASVQGHALIAQHLLLNMRCHALVKDIDGFTPLQLACIKGQTKCLQVLLDYFENSHCDGTPPCESTKQNFPLWCLTENPESSPLSLACTHGHLACVEVLVDRLPSLDTVDVNLLLMLSCTSGHLSIMAYIFSKFHTTSLIMGKNGDTLLHIACSNGHIDCVKYLIEEHKVSPCLTNDNQQAVIHLACMRGDISIVEYLLGNKFCDPNAKDINGLTPMAYAPNDKKLFRLLITNGAIPENVYQLKSKVTKHPLQTRSTVLVIGEHSAGKTTLVEALKTKRNIRSRILNTLPVIDSVSLNTIGICPHEFDSKKYGKVTFYDFAGHKEFHSSHSVVISEAQNIHAVIIVIDICKPSICCSTAYWLALLANGFKEQISEVPVIVIGSHADESEDPEATACEKQIREVFTRQAFQDLKCFDFIPMNCRLAGSLAYRRLSLSLQQLCHPAQTAGVNFTAHCFFVFLLDNFRENKVISLEDIQLKIEEIMQDSDDDLAIFLPISKKPLQQLCTLLEKDGHIFFLQTHSQDWVVLDKQALLLQVNGTVFAPVVLGGYNLASSTGIVPFQKFCEKFSDINPLMIVNFLSRMELCHKITDKTTIRMLNDTNGVSINESSLISTCNAVSSDEVYYFFPSLVQAQASANIWRKNESYKLFFGWTIQPSNSTDFLLPRFFVTLIVRIAFAFALAQEPHEVNPTNPSLERKCSMWKNGICWGTRWGIEALVEMGEDACSMIFAMRSMHASSKYIIMRSSILKMIRESLTEFCPHVPITESFIAPNELKQFPFQPSSKMIKFSLQEVSRSVVKHLPAVVSRDGTSILLTDLLSYEVYSRVPQSTILALFSSDSTTKIDSVFKDVLFALAHNDCAEERAVLTRLKEWRSSNKNINYKSVQSILDTCSVLAGSKSLVSSNNYYH